MSADIPERQARRCRDPRHVSPVLSSIRAEGYAISDRLVTDDALSVAAPIRDRYGTVQAALSLVVTAQDAQVRALVNAVRTAARGISRAIGMPAGTVGERS